MKGAARPLFANTTMPQAFDPKRDHFELFGMAPNFELDLGVLDRKYRELQTQVHPDRFANSSDAERRAAMQWATQVNAAYQTLKSPQERARYLIEKSGLAVENQGNAGMQPEFLAEQMEWREEVETARDAGDAAALASLDGESAAEQKRLHAELARLIDREADFAGAKRALFRLMFLDKLREDIGDAQEAIETAH